MDKKSYFQGTEEPTPHKKKYKSDPKILDMPRYQTPFFLNYDYADDESGPGTGLFHHMTDYKSVADFLKKKRKRNKDKYKAEEFLQEDDGSVHKKKAARRMGLLKMAIDFPNDSQINNPIIGEGDSYINSIPIGGLYDYIIPNPDFEGKGKESLNFGEDYTEDAQPKESINIDNIIDNFINPKESDPLGIPGGIIPVSDLDANETISNINQEYGKRDFGNSMYGENYR